LCWIRRRAIALFPLLIVHKHVEAITKGVSCFVGAVGLAKGQNNRTAEKVAVLFSKVSNAQRSKK